MIRQEKGRSRSERTNDETFALLKQELQGLSSDERATLELMLQEMAGGQGDGVGDLAGALGEVEYVRQPVDVETFIMDPYYLGNTCEGTYPRLRDDLGDLFSGGYHEAIFTGSIGYGKTHSCSIAICRVLYELSCLRDPHRSFGLAPGSNISIVCLSVNEVLSMKVVFEAISTKIQASPYFAEHFKFEHTKRELRFPSDIWVAARASTDTSALGLNVIGAFMDEASFLPDTAKSMAAKYGIDIKSRAESIYNGLKRRMKSRFARCGRVPGLLVVASSKRTREDFVAKTIEKSKHDPTIFVRDYATWEVKPEEYYTARKFWVLCGNETIASRIIDDEIEATSLRDTVPEDVVLTAVPEDFRPDFESDLESAIRDIAGISTVAICPYIQRREKITQAIDQTRSHPFSVVSYDPSKPGAFEWHKLVREVVLRDGEVKYIPLVDPDLPRVVHLDQSVRRDCTGFAMAHQSGWKEVTRRDKDGKHYVERAPIYAIDVMLQIVPPLGGEIDLGDVRQLIYELSAHGFKIVKVTLDSYNSVDAIQTLKKRGYTSEVLSVDRKTDPYDTLKTALYEGRVSYYEYEPVLRELRTLEMDYAKRKIDHPTRGPDGRAGSKDVADALAGTVFTLSQRQVSEELPILPGLTYGAEDKAQGLVVSPIPQPGPRRDDLLMMAVGGLSTDDNWYDLGR